MADRMDITSMVASALKIATLVFRIIKVYVEICVSFFVPAQEKGIKGWNVLITGSGHGLGREMAIKFAQRGTNLVLVDINEKNNEKVQQEILKIHSDSNIKVLTYSLDIREEAEVAKLAQRIRDDLGDIDILVNNAGIVQCKAFLDLTPSLVERTFQVNTLAHIWTIKNFLPAMIKNQRGHIVAISSIAGIIGGKYLTDYCASKFAVVGLMESLDKEIHEKDANENVRLTTVCPASMSTGMFQTFTSRFDWLLPILRADQVASEILKAVLLDKRFVVTPAITLFFHRLSSIIPTRVSHLMQDYLDYGVKPHSH